MAVTVTSNYWNFVGLMSSSISSSSNFFLSRLTKKARLQMLSRFWRKRDGSSKTYPPKGFVVFLARVSPFHWLMNLEPKPNKQKIEKTNIVLRLIFIHHVASQKLLSAQYDEYLSMCIKMRINGATKKKVTVHMKKVMLRNLVLQQPALLFKSIQLRYLMSTTSFLRLNDYARAPLKFLIRSRLSFSPL